jgi:hypothetical protein
VPEANAPRIGVRFALTSDPGELFADARAVEAAGADSLWADATDGDPYVLLAAFAAVTWRVRLVASGVADERGRETCERLARGRLAHAVDLARAGERWIHVPFPKDRDKWRALRKSAADSGAAGIVVPNDPRLIDLLRNPDVVDDRSDLNIATG